MVLSYKIYFGESFLLIQDKMSSLAIPKDIGTLLFEGEATTSNIGVAIGLLITPGQNGNVMLYAEDVDLAFGIFSNHFQRISAGGGIVSDELDRLLFIFRRGKWDLPKGKLDEGETIEQCSKREVEEECGIVVDTLNSLFRTTFHVYSEKGNMILKETFWFRMRASYHQILTPQLEEQITDIKWVRKEDLLPCLQNTYPMIRDMLGEWMSNSTEISFID